jgi:hypothetical protein
MSLSRVCPRCKEEFILSGFECVTEIINCTCDCPKCGLLLLFNEEGVVKDFHKSLHEEDSHWPVNGKGTGYLQMKGE